MTDHPMESSALRDRVQTEVYEKLGWPGPNEAGDWVRVVNLTFAALGLNDLEAAVERGATVLDEDAPLLDLGPNATNEDFDRVLRNLSRGVLVAALTPGDSDG
jgi:hypothetical protein